MLSDKYVVVSTEDWAAMVQALQTGRNDDALHIATSAPVSGDYYVIREGDVLASQGLYSYAGNIRTAVEFTQCSGLSVMTEETQQQLTGLADDLMETGALWYERQGSGSAALQHSEWGTLDS